jgi:hypothetical protein
MQPFEDKEREIRSLLEGFEDLFALFPMQSVAKALAQSREETEEAFNSRQGLYGVARKFWDVPSELLHTEIGLLIGSAFVLGQSTLTQSNSIVNRLRALTNDPNFIPKDRAALLDLDAKIESRSGLSELVIIDTAANYFKHHYEWPPDWNSQNSSRVQKQTIENARRMRLSPSDVTDNLEIALQCLGAEHANISNITNIIQAWREQVARRFYKSLNLSDPSKTLSCS